MNRHTYIRYLLAGTLSLAMMGCVAEVPVDNAACLIITHYQRILDHVNPNFVHVLIDGKIVATDGPELATKLEERGYDWLEEGASE